MTSVISGVTHELAQDHRPRRRHDTDTPTTLTVGTDTSGAQTSIGTFVTALNGLITSIQSLTSYDPTTQTAGPLLGNATLQSFQNQLSKILDQVQVRQCGGRRDVAGLARHHAPTPRAATARNSTKLGNALTANLAAVANFFGGPTGIATQLNTLINQYTQRGRAARLDQSRACSRAWPTSRKQQTALNARLATYSATLTKEYNAMDTAVALLKQTQTYLTAEFNPNAGSTSSVVDQQLA